MSYDLFFRSRDGKPCSQKEFGKYFASRANYSVKREQAFYANEDTGVYFGFEYSKQDDTSTDDDILFPVTFNINFFRPHTFGREANVELQAFVRAFNLLVSDPQDSGMGDGEYSEEGFLKGWNAGNLFGYAAMTMHGGPQEIMTLPSAQLEEIWRWNFARNILQEEMGEQCFVPQVMLVNSNGAVQTLATWGDGIPILMPKVDLVAVPRFKLAPRGFLWSKRDMVIFTWNELAPIFETYPKRKSKMQVHELIYQETPSEIVSLIRARKPNPLKLVGLPFDQVLDEELLAEAKRRLDSKGKQDDADE